MRAKNVRGGKRGGRGGRGVSANRGGKAMVHKYKEAAQMGALLKQNKSFTEQRLLRDFNELKHQNIPLLGVNACPLEHTLFTWHANIKALTNNIYKGTVLHLEMVFPKNYPLKPPTVRVLSPGFNHPSLYRDSEICLDILEEKKDGKFRGWTSAYTVQSILTQLQNFFFDIDEQFLEEREKEKGKVSQMIRSINEYSCGSCKHKGSANPWPEFYKAEGEINELFKMSQDAYRQALKGELVCYHRKSSFEDSPLGIGLNVAKAPRTGEIKGLNPIFDFVGIKSYFKERLRVSIKGERFSHWFPIYFGTNQEQFLKLCKKALSMICYGTTKKFSEDIIIKVLPKFFTGLIVNIMNEKVETSCQALRMLIYILRIIHLMIQVHPKVQDDIEAEIYKFISDPSSRVKDKTPNLGDLLTYIVLSKNHKIENVLGIYIDEKLDREIFWILQSLPEFEDLINKDTIDDVRAQVCFKTALVGNHLLLFFHYFIKKIIFKDSQSVEELTKKLDMNFGNITPQEMENHQKEIRKIMKIDNYNEYYKFLNLTPPSPVELNEKLKTSYKNSAAKGYHGTDLIRLVPGKEEQVKLLFKNFPDISALLNKDNSLLSADNGIWEKLVVENFSFVEKLQYDQPSAHLSPYKVVKYYQENINEILFTSETSNIKPKSSIMEKTKLYKFTKPHFGENILKSFTWRRLFIKLYLELYLKNFNNIKDFKQLYSLLKTFSDEVTHLNFMIYSVNNLKSDYNYVRATLGHLKNLKQLNYYLMENFNIKLIKNMIKGTSNFVEAHGELEILSVYIDKHFTPFSTKDYNVLTIIDKLPTLKVLNFSNSNIDINNALRIRNHLYYYKTIEVLDLHNTKLNDVMAKEIVDGIMKAKNLDQIYLSQNSLVKGVANIIYNLSFQPSLKVLDISNNSNADVKETAENLYKLIKMSGSLEVLIANNINKLLDNLTRDFYSSLGDNSSIKYLDLTKCGTLNTTSARNFGNAVAFNSLKAGVLNTLLIGNNGISYTLFTEMVNYLEVSEENHFAWYGALMNNNISKDSKEYFLKQFNCRLRHLDISNGNLDTYININDLKVKNTNHLRMLLEHDLHLETLNLSYSKMNKYFIDMIVDALNYSNGLRLLDLGESKLSGENVKSFVVSLGTAEKPNPDFHIETLNLGKNHFGYSGIEALSKVLKFNTTIKVLNLFHNIFDVNGARRLGDALRVNKTLQYLDIGYNRIKDLGFNEVTEGILANTENQIKSLGVRCNLIKSQAFIDNGVKVI